MLIKVFNIILIIKRYLFINNKMVKRSKRLFWQKIIIILTISSKVKIKHIISKGKFQINRKENEDNKLLEYQKTLY